MMIPMYFADSSKRKLQERQSLLIMSTDSGSRLPRSLSCIIRTVDQLTTWKSYGYPLPGHHGTSSLSEPECRGLCTAAS